MSKRKSSAGTAHNKRKGGGRKSAAQNKPRNAQPRRSAGRKNTGRRSGRRPKNAVTAEGILRKNRRGFGFVVVEGGEDIFVAQRDLGSAMSGDLVLVELRSVGARRGKGAQRGPEGVIRKVIAPCADPLVCRFERISDYGFAVPVDKARREDIYIDRQHTGGAQDGDLILVEIVRRPSDTHCAEGAVKQIAARRDERGADIRALVLQKGVPTAFSEAALAEAEEAAERGILPDDLAGRLDLREETVFTIDGPDSKDFDDAVSCRMTEEGHYLLGVHIADVSHYVTMDSALEQEAFARGNSIYLADQVIPMLPEALSNDLCSLKPGKDRLTLSCIMEIYSSGRVLRHELAESVIRSAERLVYTDVSELLENEDPALQARYAHILPDLRCMQDLYRVLHAASEARGSLDFELSEAALTIDENGVCTDVQPAERRIANRIIEAFMIKANETVAAHFCREKAPFLYRIHETPDIEDLTALDSFLAGFGLGLGAGGSKVTPKSLSALLDKVKDRPYGPAVSAVILRSMQKAAYDPSCLGHFGLALQYYTHFTSPIRRYCDLFIHRVIKASLHGQLDALTGRFSEAAAPAAEQASRCERIAVELERDVEKMKKAEYMAAHLGEEYSGTVSGVTSFGMYVELPNTVEGLVSLGSMEDDYYVFDESHRQLYGQRHGRTYQFGDTVKIRVAAASPEDREIDFVLA